MGSDQTYLSEPYPVSDTYADGLGKIEVTGQNVRMIFFTGRPKDDGEFDREVVERLVMPLDAVMPALKMLLASPAFKVLDMTALMEVFGKPAGLLQ